MSLPTEVFEGRRVLITGGLGFIGSNLARRLVALGADVTLVDSLIPEYGGNRFNIADVRHQVSVNISDVRDPHSLRPLVQNVDYLFNLAGQTSHLDSMEAPEIDLEINCKAQLSILNACRLHNPDVKLVYASTRQIYGVPRQLPVSEDHPLDPVDINGVNKLAAESYHLLYHRIYGLRTSVLRLTNTIGPRMRIRDARQTFVGIWIRRLLEAEPIEVWGGSQRRDFTYVDDAVEAFLLVAASEAANGRVFNLGGDCVISLRDLAALMVEINGGGSFEVKEFPAQRKAIDIGDYYADYGAITGALGWRPQTPLPDALAQTLAYYRSNLSHYLAP